MSFSMLDHPVLAPAMLHVPIPPPPPLETAWDISAIKSWANNLRSARPVYCPSEKSSKETMVCPAPLRPYFMGSNKSDNPSSADDNDLSSVEENGDDLSSVEGNDNGLSSADTNSDEPPSDNHIINLRPNSGRPNFSLDFIKDSPVASMLPEFLAQMDAANQELEEEKAAGTLANRRIELNADESALEGHQYIEMNLGLGVLEEKGDSTSAASESDSSSERGHLDIMEKLLGAKRKRGLEDGNEGAPKKAKIQEI